jgi:hypothetical protein
VASLGSLWIYGLTFVDLPLGINGCTLLIPYYLGLFEILTYPPLTIMLQMQIKQRRENDLGINL